MKWRNRRASNNVEDRRASGGGRPTKKLGGISVLLITLGAMYFGVDPKIILGLLDNSATQSPSTQQSSYQPSAEQQQLAEFVSVVLADTEDTWHMLFQQQGMRYQEPKLVLFSNSVRSACGHAEAAMGPFYCPGDQKVYIDLGFYQQLKTQHNAPGDFAQAYVIAHEVGHHVQTLLGISGEVHKAQQGLPPAQANQLSVKLELQADCFAGLWAHHTEKAKSILEQGDIAEALNAASAIGDDRLQKQAQTS
ncbi:KPN_02809 family neutral zinc metallopeptidase [Methyloprofundus sp.]|uniref:KPN_02809 family neutral zinc metallopeptidase n=1 Tax=Methyloprofundus sp. TaxID=2020875 RepID=UPI003D0A9692